MKRLAIFVPSLRGGGAERMMVTLANAFSARGFEVDLVIAGLDGPYASDVDGTVRVVDLASARVARSLPGLVRYLRRWRPEAVVSAMHHANVVAVAARALARVPTRVVVSQRNEIMPTPEMRASRREQIVLAGMRWAYPRAHAVVAISHGVARSLAAELGLPIDRIQVVYNPAFQPSIVERSLEPVDHPWFARGAPPVVLSVGRLTEQKDFDTLIRAFALLRSRRACRLVILGEGALRERLERLVTELGLHDAVLLPGFMANPFAWMRTSRVFVMSSAWEGFGNVLVEAMASGTPVVATDCHSGPSEILEGGRWGRLVPVGDVAAMAAAIEAVLVGSDHPPVLERARQFSVDAAVAGYLRAMA